MKRFTNILASIDTRADDSAVLNLSTMLAEHASARLKLVSVVPDVPWHVRLAMPNQADHYEAMLQEKQTRLEEIAKPLRERGIQVVTRAIRGQSSVGIIREVLRDGHDLVIRVNKGAGSRRGGFFGATSTHLLRKCPCPVWIVRPNEKPEFQRVLGALDLSHDEQHVSLDSDIIDLARSIAVSEGAKHQFVHAWVVYGEQMLRSRMTDDEWKDLRGRTEKEVIAKFKRSFADQKLSPDADNVHLVKGDPSVAIPSFVADNDIDLLIMGTVGRSGLAGMIIGNTAEMILNNVQCAVLALKPQAFVSPITIEEPADGGSIQLGEATS